MAENTETRIIKIEIDQTQALKDLEATESALIDLKEQQKALNDSLKAGTITQQEYVASKVQLDQKIQQETANRKTLTQTINTESNSLAAQKLKLKELVEQRDKIDRSTTEGAKKFDQMNGSILNLNQSIKKAEEQGGSFQRNVGNYKGTIDQFTGGAFSAAEGLSKMTVQALRFIATPIGAIIAAIALAIGSLVAYFKSSEEGQDRWNKIVTIGKVVLEKFMDIVEGFGEIVFDAFSTAVEWVGKFAKVLGISETAIGDTVDEAVKAGARLSDLQSKLDKAERESLVNNAKKRLEISELRRKADESEGQNKLRFLNEALELERQIIEQEVADADLRLEIAMTNLDLYGADKDALKAVAEAEAAVFQAKQKQFDETRKMNKERLATEKEIGDAILKRIDGDRALQQQEEIRLAKINEKADEELGKAFERITKRTEAEEKGQAETLANLFEGVQIEAEINDAATDDYIEGVKARMKAQEELAALTLFLASATASELSGIFNGITEARMMEAKNQLDAYKIQQGQELAALDEKLAKGEISEEDYKKEVLRIENDFAKKQDDVKRKAFEDNKKNQIAQARIDQAQIILGAIKSVIGVPLIGAILGAAAAAAQLIITEVQIGKIRDSQYVPGSFSMGGYTGPGGVHDPAGVVHRGEVVWNQRDVAAVGGPMAANAMRPTYGLAPYAEGGIVANGMTNQIDQQFMGIGQFPLVKLSLTELHSAENALAQKVIITEA